MWWLLAASYVLMAVVIRLDTKGDEDREPLRDMHPAFVFVVWLLSPVAVVVCLVCAIARMFTRVVLGVR